ncbi:hypothetical protein SEA_MRMIYAGI_97 [Mycobacterium phage MrMiyagi]|uniref:Uncharacterized protein n=1 Tax=Mycobacterium phage MrMiyagi TaxID=2762395 RepID=A0A7G8LPY8_9CAUD|nr:hypothetical protein SEA_MRMIYAGI_97 [Mycobacterium phage MrMiyagi]
MRQKMSDYNVGDRIIITVEYVRTVTDVKSHGGGTDYDFDRGLPSGGRKVGFRKQHDTNRFEAINDLLDFVDSLSDEVATSLAQRDKIVLEAIDALKALGISGQEIQQAQQYKKAQIRASIKKRG